MTRRKGFKKISLPPVIGEFKEALVQNALAIGIIIVFLAVALVLVKAFLYRSDYFRLKEVEIKDTFLDQRGLQVINTYILNSFKGRNVFTVNLKTIDKYLQASFPDAKSIAVRLALPDKVIVRVKFRKPVALVRSGRLYAVDEDGFLLPTANPDALKALTVIEGVGIRYDEKRGRQSSSNNLKLALELLKEMKTARFLAEYGVDTINAQESRGLSFLLKNGIEVRIGNEDFKERLAMLDKTLKDPRLVVDKVKYIDVRFKDVIVGPK
jgi:cell division septal protein FtsQ